MKYDLTKDTVTILKNWCLNLMQAGLLEIQQRNAALRERNEFLREQIRVAASNCSVEALLEFEDFGDFADYSSEDFDYSSSEENAHLVFNPFDRHQNLFTPGYMSEDLGHMSEDQQQEEPEEEQDLNFSSKRPKKGF